MGLDSPLHIILLLAIVLLIFGAKRLPEIGRSLGSGMRGFKESINDDPPATARVVVVEAETPDRGTAPPADVVDHHRHSSVG